MAEAFDPGRVGGEARSARTGRVRLRTWLLVACAAALSGCVTVGTPRADDGVRVLLYDGAGPIMIGPASDARLMEIQGARLRWGGQSVGTEWAPSGERLWRVADRTLRGRVRVRLRAGRLQVVNRVDLEAYVASTVGGEMWSSWPPEALRAQAVAARTYVLHEASRRRGRDWDVRATTESQVYRGIEAETDATRAAARATRGEILTWRGEPILAVFHSTAGGRTATAGEVWGQDRPYLQTVEVEEDAAPHTYWRVEFTATDLASILEAAAVDVGVIDGITVVGRTPSGRVSRLAIHGRERVVEVGGSELRRVVSSLRLRSTLFDVRRTATEAFAFVGSGHGHGVGMSQWGARALAERGVEYRRILARFYPGARLEQWSSLRIARHDGRHGDSDVAGRGILE